MKLAMQLYKMRQDITDKESFIAALKSLKKLGFDGVEFAGFHGVDPKEVGKIVKEIGLEVVSSHEMIEAFDTDLDGILQITKDVGSDTIVMAKSPCDSLEEIKRTQNTLKLAQERANEYGIKVLYHNHNHEFDNVEGVLPLVEVQKAAQLEFDTFWAFAKGYDPVVYLNKYKDDIKIIHLKDGSLDGEPALAVGLGETDIKALLAAIKEADIEWIVINDSPVDNAIEYITKSYKYVRDNF